MSVMTREKVDQLLEHADDCIRRALARLNVQGGPGVNVNGNLISVDQPPVTEVIARRTYSLAIFAQVTMTQNYSTSEPGQVSGIFEYEPRYVGTLLPLVDGDYLQGIYGLPMLPQIIRDDHPHPDEIYAGVVFQQDLTTPDPSTLDKFATIEFYVRGWWDDSAEPEPVFADAFAVGRMELTLTQTQFVVTGAPPDVVTLTADSEVTATYAGASATFTAFPTAANAPGDSTATIAITAARRP